ncbi:hypothetical protein AB9P05_17405 [Roseivirga sp. BDSF3-8]|uniref:hypothetical protein n=1 Tax=Roseivirga sp. BDSF3-8 TaxID=3241598 RepID=UPI0035323690
MSSVQEEIVFFEAVYHTGSIPPPYNYEYRIQLSFAGKGEIKTNYELNYRFRDELTEQEITEEGFTADDDFAWNGKIPGLWRREVLNLLSKTSWPKDQKTASLTEPYIQLFYKTKDGETFKAVPAETELWDYFLQELVQGVYELAEKERYLEVRYLELGPGKQKEEILLRPIFHLRKAQVEKYKENAGGKKENKKYDMSWENVKPVLRQVYIPDYDYEKASPKTPSKPGQYLQPGDGFWFKLGQGATNPDPERDAIKDMIETLKSL